MSLAQPSIETSVPPAILVTAQSLASLAADLPAMVRKAFGYAVRLKSGELTVALPGGSRYLFRGAEPGPQAEFVIKDYAFAGRLMAAGDIGFAEAYIAGEWETPDLTAFLYLFCINHETVATLLPGRPIIKWVQRVRHWLNRNSRAGSKRNIHAHYDLGNAFYSAWLDRTMTYSAAIFAPGDNDLASAQTRKYRELVRAGGFQPGDHILEIGCGWGGFAVFAATELNAKVTCLTISQEQFNYASQRVQEAGLADRVEIRLQDYRDERGVYDRIASIEMFEAVGMEYWPTYFRQVRERLRPGGTAALQIITIQDKFWASYRSEIDFIRRFIFPGGMLPTPTRLKEQTEAHGLQLTAERIFGHDYADTLAHWRVNFRQAWPELMKLGFDEPFRRLWEYYYAYCEAGFRSGNIDVRQLVYARQG